VDKSDPGGVEGIVVLWRDGRSNQLTSLRYLVMKTERHFELSV
jgi:hypothetical protein